MKLWILTSGFGNGHRSAAEALAEEYRSQGETVAVSDIVELLYPNQTQRIYHLFGRVICRHSWLYNALNHFGRNTCTSPRTHAVIEKELAHICPDQIITTWSGCGRKLGKIPVPVHVCITDLGVHPGWIYPHAEDYWTGTQEAAQQLMQLGISPDKIHIRGIPVKECFRCLPKKASMKKTKHLLIMGGGLGIIPWLKKLLPEISNLPDVKITVIAGKNQQLYDELKREYPDVQTVGFVHNMDQYLSQADFLISKPGGISLFESIYAATPYIAMYPSYKHELENAGFIEKKGIGLVICRGEDACHQIQKLLSDEKRCLSYQAGMVQLRHEIEESRMRFKEKTENYAD